MVCESCTRLAARATDDLQGEDEDDMKDSQPGISSDTQPKKRFSASKGWFQEFQKRYGLKSVYLRGEAASTGVNEIFKELISEGKYKHEQVYNIDESVLFREQRPSPFKDEVNAVANFVASVEAATEDEVGTFSLNKFWKACTVSAYLHNIQKALQEMKSAIVNAN